MNRTRRLIVVSNREPYTLKAGRLEKTVGGLVSALDPVMQVSKGVWVASGGVPGEWKGKKPKKRVKVPPENPSYILHRVFLDEGVFDGYYNGYSNRFLWPLCHITLDKIYLKRSYWLNYRRANRLFAEAVIEEAGRGDVVVWLHDYHLALCAGEIKRMRKDAVVSLFWHIPWPSYDVFRICPQRQDILEGMLANDLLGFQLDLFKYNFLRCVDLELGAGVDYKGGYIHYKDHTTRVRAFPISVDFRWFEKAASSKGAERFLKRFVKERGLEGLMLGLSVDRLDYTKGIIKCLEALELFFMKYPRFKDRFTFVQIAVPTRAVEPYLSYRELVRRKVASINKRFSRARWHPVEYIEDRFSQQELAALYRGSDVAIISSVYDGMNLVAKEYIASQVDLRGTLLISQFAGAAEDIPGAVIINPYDIESCADAIKTALEAEPARKRDALRKAREHIKKNDIYRWVDNILKELRNIK